MTRRTTKKIDVGAETEDDVQQFVEDAFSADFVFRSPQHLKGGRPKETTDVFVLFDDVAMPIEVKAQAANADGSARSEDPGWTKRNLEKALSQVKGAIRTVKEGKIIRLENPRRGTVQFSTALFRYVYGLIVLNHMSSPFDASELVPDLAKIGAPVHVFSFRDFFNLTFVLDTPADLIGYLEMRTDILIPTFHPKVHDEQRVFRYYLDHFEELTSFRAKHRGEDRPPELFKEHAEMYRQIYRDECDELEPSYFIDKIIDWTHQVDNSSTQPVANAERAYVVVATFLASLPRPRRQYIGRAFLDAIERAGKARDDGFAQFSSERRSECLLLLASTRAPEDRRERSEDLASLVWLLKATRQVRRALGIVTEAGFGPVRSYDFVFIDSDPEHDISRPDYGEIKVRGEDLFGNVSPR